MRFLVNNIVAILVTLGLIIVEYFYLLFSDIQFNETVNLDAPIYYLSFSFFGSGVFVSVVVFLLVKPIASKVMMSGVIFWNLIEFLENYCYLMHINKNVLIINDGSVWQIFTTLFIMVLALFGYTKFKS